METTGESDQETMLLIGGTPNDLSHYTRAPYRGRRPYRGPIRETNRKNMYGRTQTCSHFKSVNRFFEDCQDREISNETNKT